MRGFFSFSGYNEIRSMSGRYASYWNAFLLAEGERKNYYRLLVKTKHFSLFLTPNIILVLCLSLVVGTH